jgi:hypothetical protein
MVGQAEEGGHMMGDALTVVSKTGERWYEAEIHRLTGELCLQQAGPNAHHAERYFPPSLALARQQQAKSLFQVAHR